MKIISNTLDFTTEQSCVTLGKFDGVHLGHRLLFQTMKQMVGLRSVIFTFDFTAESGLKQTDLIYSRAEKEQILAATGQDYLIFYPMTTKQSRLSPEEFLQKVLIGQLNAKHIIIGSDFHFGYRGKGDADFLAAMQERYSFTLTVHEKLMYKGSEISSTRIREAIRQNNFTEAGQMLGAPYFISAERLEQRSEGLYEFSIPKEKAALSDGSYVCQVTDRIKTMQAELVRARGSQCGENSSYRLLLHEQKIQEEPKQPIKIVPLYRK